MVLASFHTFVVGLSILAQAAGQSMDPDEAKRRCDDLAASPWDDRKVGKGVDVERIVVKDALPVCKAAAEHQPAEPRHQFQVPDACSAPPGNITKRSRSICVRPRAGTSPP